MREPSLPLLWPQQKVSESMRRTQGNEHGMMTRLCRDSGYQNNNNHHHGCRHNDDDTQLRSLKRRPGNVLHMLFTLSYSIDCVHIHSCSRYIIYSILISWRIQCQKTHKEGHVRKKNTSRLWQVTIPRYKKEESQKAWAGSPCGKRCGSYIINNI